MCTANRNTEPDSEIPKSLWSPVTPAQLQAGIEPPFDAAFALHHACSVRPESLKAQVDELSFWRHETLDSSIASSDTCAGFDGAA